MAFDGDGELGGYLDDLGDCMPRSKAEERGDMALAAGGDVSARQRLVRGNLWLVVSIAKRFSRPGISLCDLVQEGNSGLVEAARRVRSDRLNGGRFATYATWWIVKRIRRALASRPALEAPLLPDIDVESKSAGSEAVVAGEEIATKLRVAIDALPEGHGQVIRLRFGLDGGKPLSFKKVGARLGVSGETARIRLLEALGQLRRKVSERWSD